jgi:chromosome segregation ATPase
MEISERWNKCQVQYREFEKAQRAAGVIWRDIPDLTDWTMDRLYAAEATIAAQDNQIARLEVSASRWGAREEALQGEIAARDREIAELKAELDERRQPVVKSQLTGWMPEG